MESNAERKVLSYGEFILPKKKKLSQKIDDSQGNFVRVNPNVTKIVVDGNNVSVVSKIPKSSESSELPELEEIDFSDIKLSDNLETFDPLVDDFILEEETSFVMHRSDEITRFLEDDKKSLNLEKKAIKLLKKYEDKDARIEEQNSKIRRPIGEKLVVIISILLMSSVGLVTYAVSFFMSRDTRANAEENNLAINSRTAADTENRINSAVSSVTMFLDLVSNSSSDSETKAVEKLFFDRNKDIVAIFYSKPSGAIAENQGLLFSSDAFLVSHEIEKETVASYIVQENESAEKAKNGNFEILNATPFFNVPLISLFCPLSTTSGEGFVAFLYSTGEIGESFASGSVNQSFLVNNDGIVLIHSDLEKMNSASDESESQIVKEMLSSPMSNGQMPFKDENQDEYIGAFRKLGIANGGVITIVKTSVLLEGVRRITYRNMLIMAAVLAISIMIIYFFAKSLSRPLRFLTEVVNEINKGNFNTELFKELDLKRQDEIGVLERSTKNEGEILTTVSRLTNKGVTKAVITKQIDFNPHLKDITIFFSDIRGFTAISDGFKKRFGERSAAEIISFLNDYMSRMVTCINKTGGIVDKFEGDAIMAAWGVLRNDDLNWEKMSGNSVTRILKQELHDEYVKADALSAITCCVAMRYSLMKYNKDAEIFTQQHANEIDAKYKPHIKKIGRASCRERV